MDPKQDYEDAIIQAVRDMMGEDELRKLVRDAIEGAYAIGCEDTEDEMEA